MIHTASARQIMQNRCTVEIPASYNRTTSVISPTWLYYEDLPGDTTICVARTPDHDVVTLPAQSVPISCHISDIAGMNVLGP